MMGSSGRMPLGVGGSRTSGLFLDGIVRLSGMVISWYPKIMEQSSMKLVGRVLVHVEVDGRDGNNVFLEAVAIAVSYEGPFGL